MVDAPEEGEGDAKPIIAGLRDDDSNKAAILIQVLMHLARCMHKFTDQFQENLQRLSSPPAAERLWSRCDHPVV